MDIGKLLFSLMFFLPSFFACPCSCFSRFDFTFFLEPLNAEHENYTREATIAWQSNKNLIYVSSRSVLILASFPYCVLSTSEPLIHVDRALCSSSNSRRRAYIARAILKLSNYFMSAVFASIFFLAFPLVLYFVLNFSRFIILLSSCDSNKPFYIYSSWQWCWLPGNCAMPYIIQ